MAELRRTYDRRQDRRYPERSSYRRKKPKKRRSWAGIFVLLVFLVIAAAGVIFLYRRFGPGTAWADYQAVYGAGAGETVVFCDGIQIEGTAVSHNGKWYLPADMAAEADCKWYYSDEGLLLYSLAAETVTIEPSAHTYTMGGQIRDVGYEIFYVEDGNAYISVDFMADFAGTKVTEFPSDQEKNLPGRLFLDDDWGTHKQAYASGKTAVRVLAGIKSPILTKTKKDSTLFIIDTVDDWTRVRTEDGFVGYIKTKYLKNEQEYELSSSVSLPEYTSVQIDGKVCLAWHQVFSAEDNEKLSYYLEGTEAVSYTHLRAHET